MINILRGNQLWAQVVLMKKTRSGDLPEPQGQCSTMTMKWSAILGAESRAMKKERESCNCCLKVQEPGTFKPSNWPAKQNTKIEEPANGYVSASASLRVIDTRRQSHNNWMFSTLHEARNERTMKPSASLRATGGLELVVFIPRNWGCDAAGPIEGES
ncbi:hypothetical protein BJX66DRAFT_229036 [Aspergillus keveii]|uniref:Uncharacterized protein n=1 Tax=Aspergillus keveii TaxID=714993 RepID=A0ABR4GL57_9EURO